MIRRRPPARTRSSTPCSAPAVSGTTAGSPTPCTPQRPPGGRNFDADRWELFHIESDRSQCHDLAAEQPEKLEELKALWFAEAAKYNGLPLGDLNIFETLGRLRPYLVRDRKTFTYYPDNAEVGIGAAAELRGQSFSVLAEVTVDSAARGGRAVQAGGRTRRPCVVRAGRPAAVRLQLHGRRGAAGYRAAIHFRWAATYSAFGTTGPGPSRAATPRSVTSRSTSTARGGDAHGRADPSRQLRARGRRRGRGPQRRSGGVEELPGALRVHRRDHR